MARRKHNKNCDCSRCLEKNKELYDLTDTKAYDFSIEKSTHKGIFGEKTIQVITVREKKKEGKTLVFLIKKVLY